MQELADTGPVGAVFSKLRTIGEQVNVAELSAPVSPMNKFLATIPFVKRFVDPVYRVMERYRKVKPVLEQHEKELATCEADVFRAKRSLLSLKRLR